MILNKDKFVRIKNANVILLHDLKAKFPQFSIQLLVNTLIENGVKSTFETGHIVFKQENAGSKKADDQPVKKSKKTFAEIEEMKREGVRIEKEEGIKAAAEWLKKVIADNPEIESNMKYHGKHFMGITL